MTKSTPPKPKPKPGGKSIGQVNSYSEEMAQFARDMSAAEERTGGGQNFISTRGGRLSAGGAEFPGNKMTAVVTDHIFCNVYYESDYNPDQPASPVCYAFGRDEKTLVPHPNCSAPQAASCAECPMNEFGSAAKGKGKACKNARRLAVLDESELEDLAGAQPLYLHVPVTSTKAWSGYVQQVAAAMKLPPFGVTTEISLVPDAKSQFRMQFKYVRQLEKGEAVASLAKHKEVREQIAFPYPEAEPQPAQQPARGRGQQPVRKAAEPPSKSKIRR